MADPRQDALLGRDPTAEEFFARLLGFDVGPGVKFPTFLPFPIPGEREEQARIRQNQFLNEVGAPVQSLVPPPRRVIPPDEAQRDKNFQLKEQIERVPRLTPNERLRRQNMVDDGALPLLRQIVFPKGTPGVAT